MNRDHARTRASFGFYNRNEHIYEATEYWFQEIDFPEAAIEAQIEERREEYERMSETSQDQGQLRVKARDDLFEDLAYWTVYFEPQVKDVDAALRAGLVPFEYMGTFYLALGAAGMKLSPKLDVYQALTYGSVPGNSKLFDQEQYFEHVVGEELTAEVKERINQENQE
jgi:hypothetical protein